MMMMDTNEEKASKIEQKLLITITSTVNVKTVSGRGKRGNYREFQW
jgi:hypothetical protein